MRYLFGLTVFALAFGPVFGDKTAKEKALVDVQILDEIRTNQQIMKNLGHLSDTIGPRLTGSPALEKANKWAAEKMKEYGLTNVKLEPYEIPLGWTRGTASLKLIEPSEKTLLAVSGGWAPGTNGTIKGDVVLFEARTRADLDKYKGKLKNAVLMRGRPSNVAPVTDTRYGPGASRGPTTPKEGTPKETTPMPKDPAKPPPDSKPPQDDIDDLQPPPEKKEEKKDPKKDEQPPPREGRGDFQGMQNMLNEFYKAEGVAAILIDSGKPHGLVVTTGGFSMDMDRVTGRRPVANLYVPHEHYAMLYRMITEQKITPKVEVNVTNKFSDGPVTVFNTVGDLPGSEKPDEFVVVGAHLDSWDLASGTTDNGTGSSVVLEVARTLGELAKKGIRPKRTIRFVLFTGEEQGLHGSRQFVKQHKPEWEKISAAIVHDTGTGKVLALRTMEREKVLPILEPELITLKQIGCEGAVPERSGGTDHLPFEAEGIPGFPCKQETDEYRFTHHTQSDTFDKAKKDNLIQGAQVIAIAAYRIADLDKLLPREPRPKSSRRGGAETTPEKKP